MSINTDEYIEQKKFLYGNILKFIEDCDANDEDVLHVLIEIIKPHELEQVLRIILSISDNHQRDAVFFDKIYKILLTLKDEIKQTYSNLDIFNIFQRNKKLLLFLIKNEIIIYEESIIKEILYEDEINGMKFCHFFLPEIKSFVDEETFKNIKDQLTEDELNNYDEKRLLGENDSYICELIRNDSIDEFVEYINRRNLSLSSEIKRSIFETNSFLNENYPTLIEYASFFGSIKIFNYLRFNKVELRPSLWLYSIHSKNAELIHLLESCNVPLPNDSYELCLIESIKCHHNDIGNYFENNFIDNKNTKEIIESSLQSYNYEFFPVEMKENYILLYLCQYRYLNLIDIWLEYKKEAIENYIQNNNLLLNRIFKSTNYNYIIQKAANKDRIDVVYYLLANSLAIKKYKFYKCRDLHAIAIPFSIKTIENNAFSQCIGLQQIIIPSSVTSIGDMAFMCCSSLKQIAIPSSVTSIGDMAFEYCSSLTQIIIPSSVTSIGNFAFDGCVSLTQITIPSSVTSIGDYTFTYCLSLKQISIPSSVTSIGVFAFSDCISLTQISIPSSVTSIGDYAFTYCLSLKQISIPSSVTSIGKLAFANCSSLTQISIPSSVKSIGIRAFEGCSSLTKNAIPSFYFKSQ